MCRGFLKAPSGSGVKRDAASVWWCQRSDTSTIRRRALPIRCHAFRIGLRFYFKRYDSWCFSTEYKGFTWRKPMNPVAVRTENSFISKKHKDFSSLLFPASCSASQTALSQRITRDAWWTDLCWLSRLPGESPSFDFSGLLIFTRTAAARGFNNKTPKIATVRSRCWGDKRCNNRCNHEFYRHRHAKKDVLLIRPAADPGGDPCRHRGEERGQWVLEEKGHQRPVPSSEGWWFPSTSCLHDPAAFCLYWVKPCRRRNIIKTTFNSSLKERQVKIHHI